MLSSQLRFLAVAGVIAIATRLAAANDLLSAVAVSGLSIAAVAAGIRIHGRGQPADWRRAWFLLATGLASLSAGTVVGAVLDASPGSFPTAADPLVFVGQVLSAGALLALIRHRLPGRAVDLLFEAATIAVALGFVIWALAIEAVSGPGAPGAGVKVLATAVPVLDLFCLWLAVRLCFLGDDHPVAYRYLIGTFLCLATAHAVTAGSILQGWNPPQGNLDALVLWSYCLWGAAALHPSLRQRFHPVSARPEAAVGRDRLFLVAGGLLIGPAVMALQALQGHALRFPVVLPATTVLPLLVAAHLLHQVRQRSGAEYRAQHDPLTGLPNQILFHDRVNVALAQAQRHGTGFAVMFVDLDRFKAVNDSLGHATGDQLLRAVAVRLREVLRAEDTVARMGGDEFTLLVSGVDNAADGRVVADKLLDAFTKPFRVGNRDLHASASIGIALALADGSDVETLLKHADTAMYRAKARSRNAAHFYTSDMSTKAQVKYALEGNLRSAIEHDELALHYQPKVDLSTGTVVGLEALVRWTHPRLGPLSPATFIPLAEETGLILPLGERVLEGACRQIRAWLDEGITPVPVAVNLSARQFEQRVEDVVARVLDETGVDAALLELELTESVFLRDMEATRNSLWNLRRLGVRCAIDDFGTGFSGLKYLAEMPIDSLKIDQSFVQGIRSARDDAPIVGAVIALAHSLRMKVVAEGVETEEQARFLRAHGCEQMQGYLFSRPLPPGQIEQVVFVDRDAEVEAKQPARRSSPSYAPGAGLAASSAGALLSALFNNEDGNRFDAREVAALIAALETGERAVPVGERMWRSASVRLAAGTFAGLMPVSGALAAAGALPQPAQQLASHALAAVDVTVPTPAPGGGLGFRTDSGVILIPAERPSRDGEPERRGRRRDAGAPHGDGASAPTSPPTLEAGSRPDQPDPGQHSHPGRGPVDAAPPVGVPPGSPNAEPGKAPSEPGIAGGDRDHAEDARDRRPAAPDGARTRPSPGGAGGVHNDLRRSGEAPNPGEGRPPGHPVGALPAPQ